MFAFAALLLLCLLPARASAQVPFRPLLGQAPLSPAGEGERAHSGFVDLGGFVGNPPSCFGSRPDGSGQAGDLLRLALADSFGGRAGFLADTLFLTDRGLGHSFRMTQFNYLLGLAFGDESVRLQVDREEDLPLDERGLNYKYWDIRGSLLFSDGAKTVPGVATMKRTSQTPWRAALTAGYFFKNRDYPARGDLTGLAFLRYAAEGELGLYGGKLKLKGAANFLTDEDRRRYRPASMGLSAGVGTALNGCEIWALREAHEILDGPGYYSAWLFSLRFPFDSK